MKKIILMTSIVVIAIFAIVSCNKKNMTQDKTNTSTTNTKKTRLPIGVRAIFTWDEWGRKKFDCAKNGLCYFRLNMLAVSGSHNAGIDTATDGSLYVDILADSAIDYADSTTNLYVDEDIISNTVDGTTLKLKAGTYALISTMGTMGGYHLPLELY